MIYSGSLAPQDAPPFPSAEKLLWDMPSFPTVPKISATLDKPEDLKEDRKEPFLGPVPAQSLRRCVRLQSSVLPLPQQGTQVQVRALGLHNTAFSQSITVTGNSVLGLLTFVLYCAGESYLTSYSGDTSNVASSRKDSPGLRKLVEATTRRKGTFQVPLPLVPLHYSPV